MNNKVLITGSSGMLGKDIAKVFKNNGYKVIGIDINDFPGNEVDTQYCIDLRDKERVLTILNFEKPEIIIYTAAIVSLDTCETDKELADKIHITVPAFIASNKNNKSQFIYISTDSVFDGVKGNYSENDLRKPLNYYSLSKQKAEDILSQYEKCLIVRTNIFGYNKPLKNSLAEWAIKKIQSNEKITGFDDVIFNAIYTKDLSKILLKIVPEELNGIINIAAKGSWSKYDFLKYVSEKIGFNTDMVIKGKSTDINVKNSRPLKTNLNTNKIEGIIHIPTIKETVINFCKNYKNESHEIWQH